MSLLEAAIVLSLVVVTGTYAAGIVTSFRQSRARLHRRVVVNLMGGKAIEGVLWRNETRVLVLKDCRLLEPGVGPQPVDGEVVVERHRVDFVQVLA